MVVGRLLSYWKGKFSGVTLNFRGVFPGWIFFLALYNWRYLRRKSKSLNRSRYIWKNLRSLFWQGLPSGCKEDVTKEWFRSWMTRYKTVVWCIAFVHRLCQVYRLWFLRFFLWYASWHVHAIPWVYPPRSNSGKWRFSSGFPTKKGS